MEQTTRSGSVSAVGVLLAAVTYIAASQAATGSSACPDGLDASAIKVQNVIALDHKTGKWFVARKLTSAALECESVRGDKAMVAPAGEEFIVVVFNTNTGLFSCSLKAEKVPVEEVAALRVFLTGLGPYLTEARELGAPITGRETAEQKAQNMVIAVRDLMTGEKGIIPTYYALNQIAPDLENLRRGENPFDKRPVSTGANGRVRVTIGDAFPVEAGKRVLIARRDLAAELRKLASEWPALEPCIGAPVRSVQEPCADEPGARDAKKEDQAAALKALVEKTLTEGPDLLAFARRTEELGKVILDAKSQWDSDPMKLEWDQGKKLTLTIAGRELPELKAVPSGQEPREAQVTALPDWTVRPGVGLSLVCSPKATFPKYTVTGTGAGATVTESGTQDSRLTYGLTLGLTWRGIDWRSGNGWSVWLPELTLNPSSDVKAVGLGVALSWRVIKLGFGMLWTKHQRVDGTKVVDTYSGNKPYVSISIIAWQPFVPKT
jgi:hypothetical protein